MSHTKLGGIYIPPPRLKRFDQDCSKDKPSDEESQRTSWDALKKIINGSINKVNTSNIKDIIIRLFSENLIRGRGLFCRSLLKAQIASPSFTSVFASLVAVINSKLPMIGELLLTRLILQFRRSYRRNNKHQCIASVTFMAHLVNQQVAHEILALELLTLLLERPTNDSVEIAVGFCKEVGEKLQILSPKPSNIIFERFRAILLDANVDVRVQWMIQVLFQIRKDKFIQHPSIIPELDLVEEDDHVTHMISLDDEELAMNESLNIFQYDPEFEENELRYNEIKYEVIGNVPIELVQQESTSESIPEQIVNNPIIHDKTETDLINFRRVVYLTIMSSLNFEECCHKLLKMNIPEGFEQELCNMIVECCSQEKTFTKFYGSLAERFCKLSPLWMERFQNTFINSYQTSHRYETNRLRNIGRLFEHLLRTSAIDWSVWSIIKLTEQDTTSAGRIFLKIILQGLAGELGNTELVNRFNDPELVKCYIGLFPTDDPRDTRFAINYFTAIGLGFLTDGLRKHLEHLQEESEKIIQKSTFTDQ